LPRRHQLLGAPRRPIYLLHDASSLDPAVQTRAPEVRKLAGQLACCR
jgi:hypothetical protein